MTPTLQHDIKTVHVKHRTNKILYLKETQIEINALTVVACARRGRATMTTEISKKRCNNIVSHEYLWTRTTCDYI